MNWIRELRPVAATAPQPDHTAVGVSFIDVLFALVIGSIFSRWSSNPVRPAFGISHLLLAFVVTITSWIGYHNSRSRPQYQIRFVNLPLIQFGIDVALVITYWLLVNSAELASGHADTPHADVRWDTIYVAVAAVLYVAWDLAALQLRKDARYTRMTMANDVPARRYISALLAVATVALAAIINLTGLAQNRPSGAVLVDAVLIVLVLTYRIAKDRHPQTATTQLTVESP